MTVIDTHTHWIPESMTRTLRSGQPWHGWRAHRDRSDREVLVSDIGVAPFSLSITEQGWPDRIERRKEEGSIDVQAIMLPTFLWNYHLPAAEAAAFCRDVNEEVADLARRYPASIVPMGVLPLQDRERSEHELAHSVGLGIRVFSIGSHVEGKNLDHPNVSPILATALEVDASVMIHASFFDRAGEARMRDYDFGNSIGVPLESGLAVMSVVYSGLLDRYPDARIGACHGGGWSAYGVGRIWLRYMQGRDGGLRAPPTDYLKRLFYDCLLHDEDSLGLLLRRVGATQVMIGTDHPYQGDMPGGSVAWIESLPSLTEAEKRAILAENAGRFLRLAD